MDAHSGTAGGAPGHPAGGAAGAGGSGGGLAESVADAVRAHPSVLRLDAGPFGSIASYLPGQRVPGVRVGTGDEPTEVAVVVALGVPFARLADEIAERVRAVLGDGVPVEVTFSDVGVAGAGGPSGSGVPPAPIPPTALA